MSLEVIQLTGQDGEDGTSATVSVGTVTTGAAGSSAAVTNVGTTAAAVFNFTIPRGATGAAGGYTSGPGYGSVTAVEAVSGTPYTIQLPYADANFSVTLADDTDAGTASFFLLKMPDLTTEEAASSHWVRVTFIMRHRERVVGWSYRAELDYARTEGGLSQRAEVVEPGPQPGSISTIDYLWDPLRSSWVVAGYAGDVSVRRYADQSAGIRTTRNLELPVYASPELVTGSPSLLADNLTGLAVIPSWVRRTVTRRGAWVELCYSTLAEAASWRFTDDPDSDVGARAIGNYNDDSRVACALAAGSGNEANLKGFVLMHELAHAVDYQLYPGIQTTSVTDGVVPGPALDLAGWLSFIYSRSGTQISASEATVETLWQRARTGGISSYYYNSRSEWFAQALAMTWADDVAGYNSSAFNSVRSATVTGSDGTLWADWLTFLGTIYLA